MELGLYKENGEIIMANYKSIKDSPHKNGRYLVKFYNSSMPEHDCAETVWREFKDGEWVNPIYNYQGDGYEIVGWYEE